VIETDFPNFVNSFFIILERKLLPEADVLIIDEISMLSCKLFDQLEYICRKVRTNDLYFGGLQVVGSCDFPCVDSNPFNVQGSNTCRTSD
jgi:hypothetical protein